MALTRRQRQVLDVIRDLIDANGYSPSLEEIGRELGLSSVATVHKHVSLLVEKGFLRRAWNQNRSLELAEQEAPAAIRLPLQGTIAAGSPLEAVRVAESIGVPAEMVRDKGRTFVLQVQGDSMIDEQIRDGDYVILEQRESARNGETVVALVDEREATLKRLFHEGDRVRLQPANPTMQPIVVSQDRVRVQGVAIGVIRRY